MKKIIFGLFVLSVLLTGCSSGGIDETMTKKINPDMELNFSDDYVLEANDFKATIKEDFLFVSSEDDFREPKLYFYEDSSEKNYINLTESSIKGRYIIHKGLGESIVIGLELGDTDYGLFATPKMLTTSSLALGIPDDPVTIRPTSGYWEFSLEGTSGDLSGAECPSGAAAFSSIGEVKMDVDQNGLSSSMNVDGDDINFYRPNPNSTHYDSYDYPFSTPTSVGTVSFEFNAIDQEKVTGKINWDNNEGCSAVYDFSMELKTPTEFPPYVLKQGTWNLVYQNVIVCGTNSIIPENYFIPTGLGEMNIVATGPNDMMPNFTFNNSNLNLIQENSSNHYIPLMPIQFLGIYNGYPLSGIYDVWATSEERAMGMLNLFGPNSCTATVPFSLEFIN